MKVLAVILLVFLSYSCQSNTDQLIPDEQGTDGQSPFPENVVDLAIKAKDKNIIELPMMYDSLVTVLPPVETTMLGEILLKKGFEQTDAKQGKWGKRGPRFVHRSFRKDDCICHVNKMYYTTTTDKLFEVHEAIHCFKAEE